jgi:hypothetical protein
MIDNAHNWKNIFLGHIFIAYKEIGKLYKETEKPNENC